jgi:hypothetical protein
VSRSRPESGRSTRAIPGMGQAPFARIFFGSRIFVGLGSFDALNAGPDVFVDGKESTQIDQGQNGAKLPSTDV